MDLAEFEELLTNLRFLKDDYQMVEAKKRETQYQPIQMRH